MGVALTELLVKNEISLDELRGKTLVVDSPMWLYQFLSSIRQRDGSLLTDSRGNVTSHLMGLLSRISNLMQHNIRLAFVFDGEPPALKKQVLQQRRAVKEAAEKKYQEALKVEDLESMKKYAAMGTRLTRDMIGEAKELVRAFGLPAIDAPSEAEAQASLIVRKGDAYAVATTDADALLFGAPRIVRNLNMAGRKKKANRLAYEVITPDVISLEENLSHLGISQDQLIMLAMLVGTDYNPKGIKGIGPKNALKMVKQYGEDKEGLFSSVKWDGHFGYPWQDVFDLIKHTRTTEEYSLTWGRVDGDAVSRMLVEGHEFSQERVDAQINPLLQSQKGRAQRGLGEFFSP